MKANDQIQQSNFSQDTHLSVPSDRLLSTEEHVGDAPRALRLQLLQRYAAVPWVSLDNSDDAFAGPHAGSQLAVDPIRENVIRHCNIIDHTFRELANKNSCAGDLRKIRRVTESLMMAGNWLKLPDPINRNESTSRKHWQPSIIFSSLYLIDAT